MTHETTKARLFDILGEADGRRLLAVYGGRDVYIPARLPADHRLARAIGFDAAARLQRALGAGRLAVPLTAPAPSLAGRVRALRAEGRTPADIARAVGCSIRTVYRYLSTDSVRVPRRAGRG